MASANRLEEALLTGLAVEPPPVINTMELADRLHVPHAEVVGAVKSLESDLYVATAKREVSQWKVSAEGQQVCDAGSPEFRLWEMLEGSPAGLLQAAVAQKLGDAATSIALSNGMKQKLWALKKEGATVTISRNPQTTQFRDTVRETLVAISQGRPVDPAAAEPLKKRKLAALEPVRTFDVSRGPKYAPQRRAKAVAELTKEMIQSGSWAQQDFKQYNFASRGKDPCGGQLHPLLKVRQEFREIFLELGFMEMETQRFVDSSFWNFETLFVPQQHPARDSQDTFFISKPANAPEEPPREYIDAVRRVHENGYIYHWSEKESRRNVLRTHTTAVSSYVLYNLAQSSPIGPNGKRMFTPGRYFSIDRVFRNEEMDKTHLCEFHQIEGFVVDRNLSLAHMMHTLHQFFLRIGVTKLRFKPAYNPYTEPSMEIFGYHSGMKRWMEVGNSGIFRPEMLQPMGFDEDVTVMAWGLSLERPTMIKYDIKNIHELFGHKVDMKFIRKSKIARF